MNAAPFIVYGLARSRTAWLASLLSYRDWMCYHELAVYMQSFNDALALLRRPRTGTVETAAGYGWRLLHHHIPELRAVVVKRPVDEVVASMLAVDVQGVATYDAAALRRAMTYGDRILDQISAHPGVLTVSYADLDREDACAALFEHCLPYAFDRDWWRFLKDQNIQMDVPALIQFYHANRDQVEGCKRACRSEMRRLAKTGLITKET